VKRIETGIEELDTILQEGVTEEEFVMFLGIPVRISRGTHQRDPETDSDRTISWSPLGEGQEETNEVETQKRQKPIVRDQQDTGCDSGDLSQSEQPGIVSPDDTET